MVMPVCQTSYVALATRHALKCRTNVCLCDSSCLFARNKRRKLPHCHACCFRALFYHRIVRRSAMWKSLLSALSWRKAVFCPLVGRVAMTIRIGSILWMRCCSSFQCADSAHGTAHQTSMYAAQAGEYMAASAAAILSWSCVYVLGRQGSCGKS